MKNTIGKYTETRDNSLHCSPTSQATNAEDVDKESPASSMTDASDSEHDVKNNVEETPICSESHEYRKYIDQVFPLPVDELFNMLFGNTKFYGELLHARFIKSYSENPWRLQGGDQMREVTYVKGLKQTLGPREVKVVETQIIKKCTKPGVMYSILTSGQNKAIPYADCFTIEMHYCMKALGPSSSHMAIYAYVNLKKSVWGVVKTFLDKNSCDGFYEHCNIIVTKVQGYIELRTYKRKPNQLQNSSVQAESKIVAPLNQPYVMPVPATPLPPPVETSSTETLISLWPYCLFLLLLFINVVLYWKLQSADTTYKIVYDELNSSKSSLGVSSIEEWSKIFVRDVLRQRGQLGAWRDALDHAAIHLLQTEKVLLEVLETIKPSLEASNMQIYTIKRDH